MMLYKNTKVKVHSPDGDTDFFDIVSGVLQRDASTPYLFIICLDYILRTSIDLMKENDYSDKVKKLVTPRINNYGRRQRWWHSASGKYTRPGRIHAGEGNKRLRPPSQYRQNEIHVL